ncbi:hypothetical protein FB567DRAFT_595840 [Paraphoma chrysanthemicola]|uniref:Uncharacterized protein n=1 Tax=Paraphoma chrysanthemicola TaxID=798071 RepID=A0A8K0QYF6_9PLEO|nr:hypothetical protein FB567DRAFT_595840 [Paraphoma chrysanthemicola]
MGIGSTSRKHNNKGKGPQGANDRPSSDHSQQGPPLLDEDERARLRDIAFNSRPLPFQFHAPRPVHDDKEKTLLTITEMIERIKGIHDYAAKKRGNREWEALHPEHWLPILDEVKYLKRENLDEANNMNTQVRGLLNTFHEKIIRLSELFELSVRDRRYFGAISYTMKGHLVYLDRAFDRCGKRVLALHDKVLAASSTSSKASPDPIDPSTNRSSSSPPSAPTESFTALEIHDAFSSFAVARLFRQKHVDKETRALRDMLCEQDSRVDAEHLLARLREDKEVEDAHEDVRVIIEALREGHLKRGQVERVKKALYNVAGELGEEEDSDVSDD